MRRADAASESAATGAAGPPAGTGGAGVSLRALSRSFGAVRALDGLSLEIAPGELVCLLGPSGCGKTTALRIVAGFESADSGSLTRIGVLLSGDVSVAADVPSTSAGAMPPGASVEVTLPSAAAVMVAQRR